MVLFLLSASWVMSFPSLAAEGKTSLGFQLAQTQTPEKYAQFLGVWSGGKWDGKMTGSLIVNSIDENGSTWVTYIHGAYSKWGIHAPGAWPMRGTIEGNSLSLDRTSRGAKIDYELSGDRLRGIYRKGANASKIELKKDVAASRTISETPWAGFQSGLKPRESQSPRKALLPDDVSITPPSAQVAPEHKSYSGTWHGWMCRDAACDTKLAVESVSDEAATIVYAFASGDIEPVFERLTAKFVGSELQGRLQSGSWLSYRLRPDGNLDVMWRNTSGDWGSGILSKAE